MDKLDDIRCPVHKRLATQGCNDCWAMITEAVKYAHDTIVDQRADNIKWQALYENSSKRANALSTYINFALPICFLLGMFFSYVLFHA